MPMIPYAFDNYILGGFVAFWVIGYTLWAIRSWQRSPGKLRDRDLAWAFVGLVVTFLAYSTYQLFRSAREKAEDLRCHSNLKDLSLCLVQYAEDHNDHLPPAGEWATDIEPYINKTYGSQAFHCPGVRSPYSYAFNKALGGMSLDKIEAPSNRVMLFECDAKTINATGSAADLVRFRHVGMSYIAFADGHVQGVNSGTAPSLNWMP